MIEPVYQYRAICERVIDGDTVVLNVDLGFRCSVAFECRLHGIDTDERYTERGKAATLFVMNLLRPISGPVPLVVQSYKDQRTFARWVCDIWVGGESLADLLRAAGHEKVKP